MALFSCASIDDNLDDCPPDTEPKSNYKMEYQLRLVTNMTTELKTQLATAIETQVAGILQNHLKDIFSDFAHDVDLSFYDTQGDLSRLQHDRHIMDANQSSYELSLPMRQYMHLAVANIVDNSEVSLVDDTNSPTAALLQRKGDVIASHTTGLFTARQPMEVLSNVNQTFNVHLYMANSAASLVIDPRGISYQKIEVRAKGFATQFNISDSTYVFTDNSPYIIPQKLETGNDMLCYCSVNFPSRDAITRAEESTEPLWQFEVYVTKADGKVAQTIIDVRDALKAGELRIVKGFLDDDGALHSNDQKVGVSVTLDWSNGSEFDSEL